MLLNIDKNMLYVENRLYARVLVNVDMVAMLLDKILVKRKNFIFFVKVIYKKLPLYFPRCSVI